MQRKEEGSSCELSAVSVSLEGPHHPLLPGCRDPTLLLPARNTGVDPGCGVERRARAADVGRRSFDHRATDSRPEGLGRVKEQAQKQVVVNQHAPLGTPAPSCTRVEWLFLAQNQTKWAPHLDSGDTRQLRNNVPTEGRGGFFP